MNIMTMASETKTRLSAKTPEYFKKIRKYAIAIGAAAIAMLTINATMGFNIHPTLITVCQYVAFICAGIAGTATLTKV